jgi:hypothetical protein
MKRINPKVTELIAALLLIAVCAASLTLIITRVNQMADENLRLNNEVTELRDQLRSHEN